MTTHLRKKILLWFLLPVFIACYLFESGTHLVHWMGGKCLLIPSSRSAAVRCAQRAGFDMVPYHPQYASYPVIANGKSIFPLSGVPHAKTLFCKEAYGWETFDADRFGFSNPDSTWNYRELDAVLLGDSFLLGECLPQQERFTSLVQAQFPKTLNLGYSSSSLLTELARFREYGKSRRPRHTFLFYYEGNDALELEGEALHPQWKKYLQEEQYTQELEQYAVGISFAIRPWLAKYVENGDPYFREFTWKSFLKMGNARHVLLERFGTRVHSSLYKIENGSGSRSKAFLKNTESIILQLKKESGRGKFHFVYLPSLRKEERGFLSPLRKLASDHQISFLDMEPVFEEAGIYPYTDVWPNHYNPEAHEVLAQKILSVLKNDPSGVRLSSVTGP